MSLYPELSVSFLSTSVVEIKVKNRYISRCTVGHIIKQSIVDLVTGLLFIISWFKVNSLFDCSGVIDRSCQVSLGIIIPLCTYHYGSVLHSCTPIIKARRFSTVCLPDLSRCASRTGHSLRFQESILIMPRHGIQLETHRGLHFHFLPACPLMAQRRFIPLTFVRDIVINEGLRRWDVRYYICIIRDTGSEVTLEVAFEVGPELGSR